MSRRCRGATERDSSPWWVKRPELLAEIEAELDANHPLLRVVERDGVIVVLGRLILEAEGQAFDAYEIAMVFPRTYPMDLPAVFETRGRITPTRDRHFNATGDACLMVPEEWLLKASDTSFHGFMSGPVKNFFVAQAFYDEHGEFPHGVREHGSAGLVSTYGELLDVPRTADRILAELDCLAAERAKGHWDCPCGSGRRLRDCCRARIERLRRRLDVKMADGMRTRLRAVIREQSTGAGFRS